MGGAYIGTCFARTHCRTVEWLSMGRTFAIGDIHGAVDHLNIVLSRLPELSPEDTVVFLGDYIDRGPSSRQVIERIEQLKQTTAGQVVTLCGNHEDAWLGCIESSNPGFLFPPGNGCLAAMRSFTDTRGMSEAEEFATLLQPRKWMPEWFIEWMKALPTYYEDEHAIYVHAGLDGEGTHWLHPSEGRKRHLMWMREPDFYEGYTGKRLIFGHTLTSELPSESPGFFQRILGGTTGTSGIWRRGSLIGIDTGCGKGGHLTCIELPSETLYESR